MGAEKRFRTVFHTVLIISGALTLINNCCCRPGVSEAETLLRKLETHLERIHKAFPEGSEWKGEDNKQIEQTLTKLASISSNPELVKQLKTSRSREGVTELLESIAPECEKLPELALRYGRQSVWEPLPPDAPIFGAGLWGFLVLLEARTRVATTDEHWLWAYTSLYFCQWIIRRGVALEVLAAGGVVCSILPSVATKSTKQEYTAKEMEDLSKLIERLEPQNLQLCLRRLLAGIDLMNIFTYIEAFPSSELAEAVKEKVRNCPASVLLSTAVSEKKLEKEIRNLFDKDELQKRLLSALCLGQSCAHHLSDAAENGGLYWFNLLQAPSSSKVSIEPFANPYPFIRKHEAVHKLFDAAYMARFTHLCIDIVNLISTQNRMPKSLEETKGFARIPEAERSLYSYEVEGELASLSLVLSDESPSVTVVFRKGRGDD